MVVSSQTRPLTVELHSALCTERIYLHVFVRGEDVTLRCTYADDRPGMKVARLYKHDAQGHCYIDATTGELAIEWVICDEIAIHAGEPF